MATDVEKRVEYEYGLLRKSPTIYIQNFLRGLKTNTLLINAVRKEKIVGTRKP